MAKWKIKDKYDKVPCRSLCEKLPRDLFSDTEYIWFKDPEYPRHRGWMLSSRLILQALWGRKPEELIPAPTADELLEKFPSVESYELCMYLQHSPGKAWNLDFQNRGWNGAVFDRGSTLVTAICKCYLKYRKESNR